MPTVRLTFVGLALLVFGTEAYAQFGLYGAPTMLQLPPVQPEFTAAGPDVAHSASAFAVAAPGPYYGGPPALVQPAGVQVPQEPAYPPQQIAPGYVSQMLREAEWSERAAACAGPPPVCQQADCRTACCPAWFVSVAALYMGRNHPNRLWTTYETDNNPNQIPTDDHGHWAVGGEITVGRYFCREVCRPCDPCGGCGDCGRSIFGVEATYWGLDSFGGYTRRSLPGWTVSTPLIVSDIEFAGVNGTQYFDGAAEHFVRRRSEVDNLEVNLLGSPPAALASPAGWAAGGCRAALGWAVGVRYFRFEDDFLFGSLGSGYSWGESRGLHEAYLEDWAANNLIGVQLGFDAAVQLSPRWRLFAAPKLGVYNNHVKQTFALWRGDGVAANPTADSRMAGSYPVRSSEDVVAFLSEIDLGVDWQVARRWSLYLGYRLIFATGIALADHQIPTYVVDIPEIADIDTNGDLVLHGAFAGLTLRF